MELNESDKALLSYVLESVLSSLTDVVDEDRIFWECDTLPRICLTDEQRNYLKRQMLKKLKCAEY